MPMHPQAPGAHQHHAARRRRPLALRCASWLIVGMMGWCVAQAGTSSASAASVGQEAGAAPHLRVCVWDVVGNGGPASTAARDYALQMKKEAGVDLEVKAYTDERVAVEDFRTGQCDAVEATSLRTRQFNKIASAIDSAGASSIVRDGVVDVKASYEVVRQAIGVFASRGGAKLMVSGQYEIAGIIPLGAVFEFVRDRSYVSMQGFAGKRVAAFDTDKSQEIMIQHAGGQPVAVDTTSFGTKFNNGALDIIFSPALAYRPFELQKGLGTKGAVVRYPVAIATYQMVIRRDRFPAGFGEKSRQVWLNAFDQLMLMIQKAEAEIPPTSWVEVSPQDAAAYTVWFRDSRIDLAKQGFYDKVGLKILKRVRCHVNPADPDCSTGSEINVD